MDNDKDSFHEIFYPLKKFSPRELEDVFAKAISEITESEYECQINSMEFELCDKLTLNLELGKKRENVFELNKKS